METGTKSRQGENEGGHQRAFAENGSVMRLLRRVLARINDKLNAVSPFFLCNAMSRELYRLMTSNNEETAGCEIVRKSRARKRVSAIVCLCRIKSIVPKSYETFNSFAVPVCRIVSACATAA